MNTFNINDAVAYSFGYIDRKISRVVSATNDCILLEDVEGFGDAIFNGVKLYTLTEKTFYKVGTFVKRPLYYRILGFNKWEFKPL